MRSSDLVRSVQGHVGSAKSALHDGGRDWSYAELWDTATSVATALAGIGVLPGRPVLVNARKSAGAVALVLGCGLAGVPAVLVSADLGRDAVELLLARTGSTHQVGLEAEPAPGAPVRLWSDATGAPAADAMPSDPPLVLTTSGSTGAPKVVPLSQAGVRRFTGWAARTFGIGDGTVVLNYAPLNFDLTLLDIWATLAVGGKVVLVDPERAADGRHLAELVDTQRVEVAQAVPLCFRLLSGQDRVFDSVRQVITTGDVLPADLLARVPTMFPNATLHNIYGCTETNDSFRYTVTDFAVPAPLPIGRPIDGVQALLVDEDGAEVHGEGRGELLVSTPFQADGYLDPDLTAKRFTTGVAGHTGVFYRSGDIVRRDADGLFHLDGRDDFHVKVRGVRTNLQEVEYVLERHPDVDEVAVVAIPDAEAGYRLHAAVRAGADGTNSLVLRSHCARSLPRTAIPSTFQIQHAALPRTSTGKIDRNAISESRQEAGV
ncbi:AMP-binding protein [Actinokineospora inagensis]|uniref:AMP-binding protein n=1 Tax=Actinokineospora inagensis TaxID=103730 RepID=UPI00047CB3E7|nr:AMP-binding protein [Actinokineospora inagensis]